MVQDSESWKKMGEGGEESDVRGPGILEKIGCSSARIWPGLGQKVRKGRFYANITFRY